MESIIEQEYLKAKIAAGLNAETLIPNLMQLIGYRQRVAQEMLRCEMDKKEDYKELFNYTNDQIKKLLAI